jgi:hypothetical protein
MKEKNEVEEAVRNYIRLQEKEKEIKKLLSYWRAQLMETIKGNHGLPIEAGDVVCRVVERVTYTYDPGKLTEAIGPDAAKLVITQQVDVRKLKGLIKGGIITEEAVNQTRQEVKRVQALVIEKMKGEDSDEK